MEAAAVTVAAVVVMSCQWNVANGMGWDREQGLRWEKKR